MSTALVFFLIPPKKDSISGKLCARGCEPCETRWVGGGGGGWRAVARSKAVG